MSLNSRLEALEQRGLIRRLGRSNEEEFLFRHTLFQETAYLSLLRGERASLHRSVADILERVLAEDDESAAPILAYHFKLAGNDLKALHYFTLAAKSASKVYANHEAIRHYQQAIDLALQVAPEASRLAELFLGCGRLHELMGDFAGAVRIYDTMQTTSEDLGFPSMEINARVARDTLYSAPSAVSDPSRALVSAKETLKLARETGDKEAEARSLWNLMLAGFFSGDDRPARDYGDTALAIARQTGDKQLLAFIMNDLSRSYLFLEGLRERGLELANRAIELWKDLDNVPMLADGLSGLGLFRAYSGDFPTALDLSDQSLALSTEIDNPWGMAYAQYVKSMAYWEMGDYLQTMAHGDEAIHLAEAAGFAVPQVAVRAMQAWAMSDLGQYDRALVIAEEAASYARSSLPSWRAMGVAMQVLVQLARSGRANPAQYDDLHSLLSGADKIVFPVAEMYALLAEATHQLCLGDGQQAAEFADQIIALQGRLEFKSFAVDARFVRARALRLMGQIDSAWEALEGARDEAESAGSGRTLWRVQLLMSAWAKEDRRPDAEDLKARAKAAIESVLTNLKDEWRESFLAKPDVANLMSS